MRLIIHRKGDRVWIFTEDKKINRADAFPEIVKEVLALPCSEVILDTEFVLWEEGKPLPRLAMVGLVTRKEPYIKEDVRVNVHDILWWKP